jgi:hypothetical protein
MAVGIGAAGIVGIARELVNNTYRAPEKYVPVLNESLKVVQSNIYRRPIRSLTDPVGAVAGPYHVEGSVTMEALDDCLPYFMCGMRGDLAKSIGAANDVYTLTPNAKAQRTGAGHTLSLTVERNGIVFGYAGCVVGSFQFTVQDGILVCTMDIVGVSEAVQGAPSATWPTSIPPGPGQYIVQIPTATQVYDVDTFTVSVDDGAEAQNRLRDDTRGATFVLFGERETTMSLERDFESRVEFDAFKAATAQAIMIKAAQATNNYVQINMYSGIKDSYELGLSGQGDLVRGSVEYQGVYSVASGKSYQLVVATQESLALLATTISCVASIPTPTHIG